MEDLRQKSILTSLIQKLELHGSWAGETRIQKTVFFLTELFAVDLGVQFILYKHGPYSFDLHDLLCALRADLLVQLKIAEEHYGPAFVPGRWAENLIGRYPKTLARWAPALDFVAEHVAVKSVKELERWATVLYVLRREQLPRISIPARVVELKPHITLMQAQEALEEVEALLRKATDVCVVA